MPLIAIVHISSAVLAVLVYIALFIMSFIKTVKRETFYWVLTIANLIYWSAMIIGAFWAKLAWGRYFLFDDIKFIISMLIIFPFAILNFTKKREKLWTSVGAALVLANYILPLILDSLHAHGI